MFVATESFTANTTNGDVHVEAGVTIVAEADELYRHYPDKFEPYKPRAAAPEVEQATAAPGEKRGAQ